MKGMHPGGFGRIPVYVSAILLMLADQATKYFIQATVSLYESVPVINGFFNITHVRNPGAAFGILAGLPSFWRWVLLVGITVVIMAAIVLYLERSRTTGKTLTAGLTLILGGAAGNLVDRVSQGEVIDFLDFYIGSWHWPAFNVADAAITVGAALVVIDMIRTRERAPAP